MGYETELHGQLVIQPELIDQHKKFLEEFFETRHEDGRVWSKSWEPGKVRPKDSPPSIWCPWKLCELPHYVTAYRGPCSGLEIPGDGKHYGYVAWLQHIVNEFLAPNGYEVNGRVCWQGDDTFDVGVIVVKANQVKWHCVEADEQAECRAFS